MADQFQIVDLSFVVGKYNRVYIHKLSSITGYRHLPGNANQKIFNNIKRGGLPFDWYC